MLPSTIPIFPLPNVVLFPNVFLPLHIFEARYRTMVSDALAGDRIIGMVLLRPGYEADYEGRPPVFAVGCTGVITHSETLPDGCSNIVLKVMKAKRLLWEDDEALFVAAATRESRAFGSAFGTKDHAEGIGAFLDKRKAAFTGA